METTVIILEYIGVASAAISGTMVGIEKKADAFGVLFLAMFHAMTENYLIEIVRRLAAAAAVWALPFLWRRWRRRRCCSASAASTAGFPAARF